MTENKIELPAQPLIKSTNSFPVVGVGASAGGLEAFTRLLSAIPPKSGMAYVLVQHLHPKHESMLTDILQKVTPIEVVEIVDEIKILPDHIYIIPSNKILIANDGRLELGPRVTNKNQLNLPIDIFFTSLAEVHQSHAIGVVLSGTASDGTQGLKAIKEQGGLTFAQDEASAAFEGMPHSAMLAGVVDFIMPPEQIPAKIQELVKITESISSDESNLPKEDVEVFRQILGLLRIRKGTDFTYYKPSTIHRRIIRRMAMSQLNEPAAYVKVLLGNNAEQDALYQDLLIPVTAFFRDPLSFDALCETIIPRILKNKNSNEAVRFWVAGCSTGEEAYSIAICMKEKINAFFSTEKPALNENGSESDIKVQIFASDLSEPAIAKARAGIYKSGDIDGISGKRLQEFFTKNNGGYLVNKEIRDMCIFAVHNFIKEPPFGKMDFISCRNVLIYMEPYLQKKALAIFHYALKPGGTLMLGKSENISIVPDLFAPDIAPLKIFIRKDAPVKFMYVTPSNIENKLQQGSDNSKPEITRTDFQKAADDIMLSQFTPASVVVNEALDIVHFRGNTSDFLMQSAGKPSHNLLKMAKHGLGFELRNILHKAKKNNASVIKENIPLEVNSTFRKINIQAIPLTNGNEPHYLILFHDNNLAGDNLLSNKNIEIKLDENKDLRITYLEQELAQNREDMRNITEDQEAVNEEMQSVNEELLSSSEELQSLYEELETSKEELQSTNEELIVVNQELVSMNELISIARDYSQNIIATIREPFVVLDKQLRVKTANSAFYKTFHVTEQQTEGVLLYKLGNGQWDIPLLRNLLEDVLPQHSMFADYELKLSFPNIGERTVLLNAREIKPRDGSERMLLLTIADITDHKIAKQKIAESQEQFAFIADSIPQKVWTADADGKRNYFNKQWIDYSGLTLEELENDGWKKIVHPKDLPATEKLWQQAIETGNDYEVEDRKRNKEGHYKWHLTRATAFKDDSGKIVMWVGTNTEMEKQKNYSVELEKDVADRTSELEKSNHLLEEKNIELSKMNIELESFTYVSSHDLQEPLRKIQTFAGRLLEKEHANLSESGKDMFLRMQEAGQRMQALIQDLLAFSRLSNTERKFEIVDLNQIMEQVKNDFKEVIEEKNAIVEIKELCDARIIRFQFYQLMQNLISNALKFSKPDVQPHIIIKDEIISGKEVNNPMLTPNKKYCHIIFSDNGIGFEPEFNQKIFEVFQKLHGRDEYAGTGIGLAIVKKIIENHDGVVTATSDIGKGARFDIYIPA